MLNDLTRYNDLAWNNAMARLAKARPEYEAQIINELDYLNHSKKLLESVNGKQHRRWDIKAA